MPCPSVFCRHSMFHQASLTLAIATVLGGSVANAAEKLDMSFIQGGASLSPEVWASLNGTYVPGRYLVDLSLNGKSNGKHLLDITPQDSEALCLTGAWLEKIGVYINPDYFRQVYDSARQCWVLSNAPSTVIDFDVSTQTLSLSIPQSGLMKRPENIDWNYGTSAFRLNYNVNANTGKQNSSAFGTANMMVNVGSWVANSNTVVSVDNSGNNETTVDMLTATRAIRSLSADLALGKTSTGNNLLGSTGTYGVSLSRNNSMRPGNLGYSPVFSGSASGPSRVTLTQGDRTLHSEMVPAGPFSITDVQLYTSGDVFMEVTDENGRQQTQVFPLSVINGQLSAGESEFNVAGGIPDDDSDIKGVVFSSSYGYGINNLTLRAGNVLNQNYKGITGGIVVGLGGLGALSVDEAYATANYRKEPSRTGGKTQLSWTKMLGMTGTGLRLNWSTQDEEFDEMSSFDSMTLEKKDNRSPRIKNTWNIGVSQPIRGLFSVSLSGWQRDYYKNNNANYAKDTGITGTLGTQIKGINVNVGAYGSRDSQNRDNWSISTSISVPFSLFDRRYSSNTQITKSKNGSTGINTGISGSLDERVSYGVGVGRDGNGGMSTYLNSSYSGDKAYMSGVLNQSSTSGTSGSVSVSGSMLGVPAARSVMFSRVSSETVAVVGVKDTPGVATTSSDVKTNNAGNAVVPLNNYNWNTVSIDAATLPRNTELTGTSQKVVPTDKAVIWMPFEVLKVKRYLLQVKQKDGSFVQGGIWARDSQNTPLGFVANNGVLFINAVDTLGDITLGQCRIPANKMKETDKLQEIMCDEVQ